MVMTQRLKFIAPTHDAGADGLDELRVSIET